MNKVLSVTGNIVLYGFVIFCCMIVLLALVPSIEVVMQILMMACACAIALSFAIFTLIWVVNMIATDIGGDR